MRPPADDVRMRGFRARADLEEVRRLLRAALTPLPAETVPVTACAGRVLAAAMVSPVDVPGFHRAAMDGYAVRAEDTFGAAPDSPLPLRLAGDSLPGRPFKGEVGPGTAVRIMTGAPVPSGADAVLPAEQASESAGQVLAAGAVTPGKNVGRRGEDVAAGTTVLTAGRRLRPQDAGLLASVGAGPVPVVRRPRVDLLITGDEIVPAGEAARPDGVLDSNSVMLAALARRDGGRPSPPAYLPDRAETLAAALGASQGDAVLISGGSSVGLEDHAPQVVAELGRLAAHGVALRPASPAGVGFLPPAGGGAGPERPVFLIPGNPVSCLCAYDLLAGPAIRRLAGLGWEWPYPSRRLPLARKVVSVVGRVDYLRVRVASGMVEPLAIGGAGILSSAVRADGFVVVARDAEGHAPGEEVDVFLYDAPVLTSEEEAP